MSRHARPRPAPRHIAAGALACTLTLTLCAWANPRLYDNQTSPAPASPIHVTVDGRGITIPRGGTVDQALATSGIQAGWNGTITPSPDTTLHDGDTITTVNPVMTVESTTGPIPHGETRIDTNTLPAGTIKEKDPGADGTGETTTLTVTIGDIVDRHVLTRTVTTPPRDRIILVGTGAIPTPKGDMQQWAHDTLIARGGSEADWMATDYIIQHESGWRVNAGSINGAYGLPQANPGTKMASMGANWATDYKTQLEWFWNYCTRRYGSIQGAYEHWLTAHNY